MKIRGLLMLACGILPFLTRGNGMVHGLPRAKSDWENWKHQHNKVYSSAEEEQYHGKIWEENYKLVEKHNSNPNVTFKMEMNFLADQKSKQGQHIYSSLIAVRDRNLHDDDNIVSVPDSWDWREKGAVTPVKYQRMMECAFDIVAAECVESFHFIQTKQLVSASSWEVHDCCTKSRCWFKPGVFQCIHNIGGLCSTAAYPQRVFACKNDSCTPVATVNGGRRVPKKNEEAMKVAVYKTPVFALVHAGRSFMFYKSGVYSVPNCPSTRLNHALQVVGYGSVGGRDYWICKNSWGTSWGMQGYIKIARNKGDMCGIASFAIYPD